MPWVKKDTCNSCGVCVESCVAGAIQIDEEAAFINDTMCIRCGVCHEVCPSEAVRHDGELIPFEVKDNISWVKKLLENDYYSSDPEMQKALLGRLERYFNKSRVVAEKTIEQIRSFEQY